MSRIYTTASENSDDKVIRVDTSHPEHASSRLPLQEVLHTARHVSAQLHNTANFYPGDDSIQKAPATEQYGGFWTHRKALDHAILHVETSGLLALSRVSPNEQLFKSHELILVGLCRTPFTLRDHSVMALCY